MRRTHLLLIAIIATTLSVWAVEPLYGQSTTKGLRELLERKRGEQTPAERTIPDNNVILGQGGGSTDWSFPDRADQWLNSPALKGESLRGKGIVLLFFEEECVGCLKQWPEVLKLSNQYANRPVIFIAVNSGSDPRTAGAYVRRGRINWPVIVDSDRSFENEMGVSSVSLDNVIQVRYITADGANRPGKWSDLPATTEAALEGAAWRVNPGEIPRELQGAWRAIEIGVYADAAKSIRKGVESKKAPIKSAATKLLDAVNEEMEADLDKVRDALRKSKHWEAYKGLGNVAQRFDGYEIPELVLAKSKELAKRDDVKAELAAKKTLDKARATAAKGSNSARKRALSMLERLVASSPSTEAATEAQTILANLKP